ncbi:MAG: hypothetical protein ACF8CQ_18435 [Rhodopirellula sp. JB044]|uniref:hypothetical protein n=1 Tax=Rhodopirellula sp. JB044 TaxID=3342844 RepID=UPI00370B1E82
MPRKLKRIAAPRHYSTKWNPGRALVFSHGKPAKIAAPGRPPLECAYLSATKYWRAVGGWYLPDTRGLSQVA